MKNIMLLFKKDIYRYRWPLLVLLVIAISEVYLYGSTPGLMDTGLNRLLTVISSVFGALIFFFLIILVVQEETLADPQAYWLGRPLSRRAILIEKLLFLGMLLILFTISEVMALHLNGGGRLTGYVLFGLLPAFVIWQLQIYLAAQTSSLAKYLLLTFCLVIGFYGFMYVLFFVIQPTEITDWDFGLLPQHMASHWVSLIRYMYWLIAGLGILTFLYQRRRVLWTWGCFVVAGLLSLLLTPSESFPGTTRSLYQGDHRSITIDHLRLGGTIQQQGQEFVQCEIVFKSDDPFLRDDVWIRMQRLTLREGVNQINTQATGLHQRMVEIEEGRFVASAGLIERSQLEQLTGEKISVTGFANLYFSNQYPIGTLSLQEGSVYRGAGSRLLVDSLYRRDHILRATITGVTPQLHFVPNEMATTQEPFRGRLAFALLDMADEKPVADFRVRSSFTFSPGRRQVARIEVPLAPDASQDDYIIAIYERQITHQQWQSLNEQNVPLIR